MSQGVLAALLSSTFYCQPSLNKAFGKLSPTVTPSGLLWIINFSSYLFSFNQQTSLTPDHLSVVVGLMWYLHEEMGLEHQILLQCFALGSTVIITTWRRKPLKTNAKKWATTQSLGHEYFKLGIFIGNRDPNLVYFFKGGRWNHVTLGYEWEDRSLSYLHVWFSISYSFSTSTLDPRGIANTPWFYQQHIDSAIKWDREM